MATTWRTHVGVFGLLAVLIVLCTWPLFQSPVALPLNDSDARQFTWVMLTICRNLVTRPWLLMHGNAFYPFGNSLTLAEPLLAPSLVAAPLFALTGAAIAAYKATLLFFWTVSGWAMYAVARSVTRSHPAALVAALIFTLSPPRLEYSVEFQMEMAFGLPLAVFALVRFLERQRGRDLLVLVLVFWLQAVTTWYYTVTLGLGLVVVTLQYVALRWRGWRLRTLLTAGAAAAGLALALAPVAWPYFVTRRELGLERGLEDVDATRFADLLTYVTTRGTWLAQLLLIDRPAETSLFVGATALAVAALSVAWLRPGRPRGRAERWLAASVWLALGLTVAALVAGRPLRIGPVRSPFSVAAAGVLVLAFARQVTEGWRRARNGLDERRLTDRDWVGLLLGLLLFAVLLSLGPVVHVAGRPVGVGLYAWLYPLVFPLHAIRSPTRIGLLAVFALAFLAGFGAKWLAEAQAGRRGRWMVLGLALLVSLESATVARHYAAVPVTGRAVDRVLRADRDDVAVLEWPTNWPSADADAMFRSIVHGKRVVNGWGGFIPDLQRELSGLLTRPGPPFPAPEALEALRQIYPLRYLVVRLADPDIPPEWPGRWRGLRTHPPPLLRFRGGYGDEDLYEVVPLPQRGLLAERLVSYDFLDGHPRLHLAVRPLVVEGALDQWVELQLDGRVLEEVPLNAPATAVRLLSPPWYRSAPNRITLSYRYRRPPAALDESYRIGATGARIAGDLRVTSAGQPEGSLGSIQLNGVELSPDRRGYDLVALEASGRLVAARAFDTAASAEAASALAAWVRALPEGTIVAGAARDEASSHLTGSAVAALQTLGSRGDLRGHYREAHAFIGVKGAPAGSALEALGPRRIELVVGRPEAFPDRPSSRVGFEVTGFDLRER